MKLKIEIDNLKITLSVGPEGVTIDAPLTDGAGDETTTQTTLSEARWEAYARGRSDERRHRRVMDDGGCSRCDNPDTGGSGMCDECFDELRYDDFEELAIPFTLDEVENDYDAFGCCTSCEIVPCICPPKVDPITGNISDHVKAFRTLNRNRAPEVQPREVCYSSCCGTAGARTRDGSCKGCR